MYSHAFSKVGSLHKTGTWILLRHMSGLIDCLQPSFTYQCHSECGTFYSDTTYYDHPL